MSGSGYLAAVRADSVGPLSHSFPIPEDATQIKSDNRHSHNRNNIHNSNNKTSNNINSKDRKDSNNRSKNDTNNSTKNSISTKSDIIMVAIVVNECLEVLGP